MVYWVLGIALLLLFLNLLFFYMQLVEIKEEREDEAGAAAIHIPLVQTIRVVRASLCYTIVVLICTIIIIR